MKKNLLAAIAVSLVCVSIQAKQIKTQFYIGPAPTSPSYTASMINIMAFMTDQNWSPGFIPTYFPTNPAALDMPPILRGCQICYCPGTYYSWDGTNNPTGNFALENGSRIVWGFDIQDTNLFLVTDGTFASWSTDQANTLGYTGNLGTNTANNLPQTFGPNFRGQIWSGGTLVADYSNGESITNPVTRLVGNIRVGYYFTTSNALAADLNYFRAVMELTNYFAIVFPDGVSTNSRSTIPYFDNPIINGDGTVSIDLEGQRQLGLYYSVIRTFNLGAAPVVWKTVVTNGVEGVFVDSRTNPMAFYKAIESGTPVTPLFAIAGKGVSKVTPPTSLRLVIDNSSK